jgi:N-hydroxyarylamine O-acetyltransferase
MKLKPYLDRIGLRGRLGPDLATLEALHRLHPAAIPFENLSTLLGEPVRLEPEAIEDKLIRRRRGGYCFEHNALFRSVLEALGFELVPLAASVVWNRDQGYENPRTHMALLVSVGTTRYLCDVGFGAATLTSPLDFAPGRAQTTPHEIFKINMIGDLFELSINFSGAWRAAYQFDLQPQRAVDYEAMNHFVQTWPDSHFRSRLMAARPIEGGRLALGGNEFSRYRAGRLADRRSIVSSTVLKSLLTDEFGIELPADERLDGLLERIARVETS